MWGSVLGHRPQSSRPTLHWAAVRHEALWRAAAGDEIIEQAKKGRARDRGAQEPLDRGVPPPSR